MWMYTAAQGMGAGWPDACLLPSFVVSFTGVCAMHFAAPREHGGSDDDSGRVSLKFPHTLSVCCIDSACGV